MINYCEYLIKMCKTCTTKENIFNCSNNITMNLNLVKYINDINVCDDFKTDLINNTTCNPIFKLNLSIYSIKHDFSDHLFHLHKQSGNNITNFFMFGDNEHYLDKLDFDKLNKDVGMFILAHTKSLKHIQQYIELYNPDELYNKILEINNTYDNHGYLYLHKFFMEYKVDMNKYSHKFYNSTLINELGICVSVEHREIMYHLGIDNDNDISQYLTKYKYKCKTNHKHIECKFGYAIPKSYVLNWFIDDYQYLSLFDYLLHIGTPVTYSNIIYISKIVSKKCTCFYYAVYNCKYNKEKLTQDIYDAYERNDYMYIINNKHVPDYKCVLIASRYVNNTFVHKLLDNYIPDKYIDITPRFKNIRYLSVKELMDVFNIKNMHEPKQNETITMKYYTDLCMNSEECNTIFLHSMCNASLNDCVPIYILAYVLGYEYIDCAIEYELFLKCYYGNYK